MHNPYGTPRGNVAQMETFAIKSPMATHFRPGTCAEVEGGCPHHTHGWDTIVDEGTSLGAQRAGYIRRECDRIGAGSSGAHLLGRRRYTEHQARNGLGVVMTTFHFPAGQDCFMQHQVPLERPEKFIRRPGDWRGMPDRHLRHVYDRPEQWADDFVGHQQRLSALLQKG